MFLHLGFIEHTLDDFTGRLECLAVVIHNLGRHSSPRGEMFETPEKGKSKSDQYSLAWLILLRWSVGADSLNLLGQFSMSPLPRLHRHDILTIVELFFIYVSFITIRCVVLVC